MDFQCHWERKKNIYPCECHFKWMLYIHLYVDYVENSFHPKWKYRIGSKVKQQNMSIIYEKCMPNHGNGQCGGTEWWIEEEGERAIVFGKWSGMAILLKALVFIKCCYSKEVAAFELNWAAVFHTIRDGTYLKNLNFKFPRNLEFHFVGASIITSWSWVAVVNKALIL